MCDNADRHVVTVVAQDLRSRVRHVELPTGYSRTTSRDTLKVAGVRDGQLTTESALDTAITAAEEDAARSRALRILGHRERSTAHVCAELLKDGYPKLLADDVTRRLSDIGLLDDERFTEAFVRAKALSGWGRGRIDRALRDAGIQDGLAYRVLDELVPGDQEIHRACRQVPDQTGADRRSRERILRRLLSRGFSYETALQALSGPDAAESDHPRNESES